MVEMADICKAVNSLNRSENPPAIGHNSRHRSEPFTRVPASYIGRCADGQKAAMPALHLLALKLSRGGLFVLNAKFAAKRLGMALYSFKSAIRHLKKHAVINRQKRGCGFPSEQLVAGPAGEYHVPIADSIINNEPSDVVAFILVANVSPTARTPQEIAARIGLKAPATIRRVRDTCAALRAVDMYTDNDGAVRICRPGEMPVDGGCQISTHQISTHQISTHVKKEDCSQRKRQKHKEEANIVDFKKSTVPTFNEVVLADWRTAPALAHMIEMTDADGGCGNDWDGIKAAVDGTAIAKAIAAHGQSAPAHFLTDHGIVQFRDLIAAALSFDDSGEIEPANALDGICGALAHHMRQGRTIRSLALVAQSILRACHFDDFRWVTQYPSAKLGDKLTNWQRWAEATLLPALESGGAQHDETKLLATRQLERLAELFRVHGQHAIEQACRTATIEPGCQMIGWSYLFQSAALPSERRIGT